MRFSIAPEDAGVKDGGGYFPTSSSISMSL